MTKGRRRGRGRPRSHVPELLVAERVEDPDREVEARVEERPPRRRRLVRDARELGVEVDRVTERPVGDEDAREGEEEGADREQEAEDRATLRRALALGGAGPAPAVAVLGVVPGHDAGELAAEAREDDPGQERLADEAPPDEGGIEPPDEERERDVEGEPDSEGHGARILTSAPGAGTG